MSALESRSWIETCQLIDKWTNYMPLIYNSNRYQETSQILSNNYALVNNKLTITNISKDTWTQKGNSSMVDAIIEIKLQ